MASLALLATTRMPAMAPSTGTAARIVLRARGDVPMPADGEVKTFQDIATTTTTANSAGGGMPGPGLPLQSLNLQQRLAQTMAEMMHQMAADGSEVVETFQDFEAMGFKPNAAAASGEGAADEDEFENLCSVCLDNEDDATVDGKGHTVHIRCASFVGR